MRLLKQAALTLALVLPLFMTAGTAALDVPPAPTGIPILDQANILSAEQEKLIAQKIAGEESATGNQIGILTVPSLQGEAIEDYSIRVAREWGIGTKERNNGVLLLVAVEDRRMRIEVGYGLEGALTDLRSSQIIRDRITPEFKNGRYYEGINSGVDGIIAAIHNESDPNLNTNSGPESSNDGFPIEAIIYGLLFIPTWLGAILARTKSWWAGGVIGAVIGAVISMIFGFLLAGLLSIIGLTLIGLLFDKAVSGNFAKRKQQGLAPSWWAGGTHLGGGGGSGGFGGGSFGGGGSSGSW